MIDYNHIPLKPVRVVHARYRHVGPLRPMPYGVEEDVSDTKCPKCGAEWCACTHQWECGTKWRRPGSPGAAGLFVDSQSDKCRIRELEAENDRLRADAKRLVYAIRMCDWGGEKVQDASVHEALDAAIDAAMKGGE